jgi:hypothetical protein
MRFGGACARDGAPAASMDGLVAFRQGAFCWTLLGIARGRSENALRPKQMRTIDHLPVQAHHARLW